MTFPEVLTMTIGTTDTANPESRFRSWGCARCVCPAIGTSLAQSTVPITFASHKPS
jgi:hypothetical protein